MLGSLLTTDPSASRLITKVDMRYSSPAVGILSVLDNAEWYIYGQITRYRTTQLRYMNN